MHKNKLMIAAAIAMSVSMTACNSDDTPEVRVPTTQELSGKVIDGYIQGAVVFLDENNNMTLDDGEISTVTDETGTYSLTVTEDRLICSSYSPLVVNVGIDAVDLDKGSVTEAYQLVLAPLFDRDITTLDLHVTPLTTQVFTSSNISYTCQDYLSDPDLKAESQAAIGDAEDTLATFYGLTKSQLYSDVTLDAEAQAAAEDVLLALSVSKTKKLEVLNFKSEDNASQLNNELTLLSATVSYSPWENGIWIESIERTYLERNVKTYNVQLVSNLSTGEYAESADFSDKLTSHTESILEDQTVYSFTNKYFHNDTSCMSYVDFSFSEKDANAFKTTYKVNNVYEKTLDLNECVAYIPSEDNLTDVSLSVSYPTEDGLTAYSGYFYTAKNALASLDDGLTHLNEYNSVYKSGTDTELLNTELVALTFDDLNYAYDNSDINLEYSIVKTYEKYDLNIHTSYLKMITKNLGATSVKIERTTTDSDTGIVVEEVSLDDGVTWSVTP